MIVIGSGFGGSVTALRLTEKGYRVGVLEAGRRWNAEDLPKTNWNVRKSIWAPRLGLTGPQRISVARQVPGVQRRRRRRRVADLRQHALRAAARVLPGPGVGAHHRLAGRAGARTTTRPSGCSASSRTRGWARRTRCCCQVARDRGVADTFHKTQVGVFFNEGSEGVEVPRPVLRRRRPAPVRLHPLLGVLHRLQAQRQEHHDDQLPLPGREQAAPRCTRSRP